MRQRVRSAGPRVTTISSTSAQRTAASISSSASRENLATCARCNHAPLEQPWPVSRPIVLRGALESGAGSSAGCTALAEDEERTRGREGSAGECGDECGGEFGGECGGRGGRSVPSLMTPLMRRESVSRSSRKAERSRSPLPEIPWPVTSRKLSRKLGRLLNRGRLLPWPVTSRKLGILLKLGHLLPWPFVLRKLQLPCKLGGELGGKLDGGPASWAAGSVAGWVAGSAEGWVAGAFKTVGTTAGCSAALCSRCIVLATLSLQSGRRLSESHSTHCSPSASRPPLPLAAEVSTLRSFELASSRARRAWKSRLVTRPFLLRSSSSKAKLSAASRRCRASSAFPSSMRL